MKLTEKIIEFIDNTTTLADGTTRMISQDKLGRWICHSRNLERDSEKSSDICSVIYRLNVEVQKRNELIMDGYNKEGKFKCTAKKISEEINKLTAVLRMLNKDGL